MKRIFLLAISSILLLAFSGCKKESENGGISFSFIANKSYEYASLSVMVSSSPNAAPIKQASTNNIQDGVKITGLTPGTYYWNGFVEYRQPPLSGTYNFNGTIIIEKGKLMHITLEN